jgi:hypothetical protein
MRIEGWERLWIIVVVLYGICVALVAYDSRPQLAQLQDRWIDEALGVFAKAISRAENTDMQSQQLRESWFNNKSNTYVIAYLNRIERKPNEKQKLFSPEVGAINERYRQLANQFRSSQIDHAVHAFVWWIGPSFALLILGCSTAWVANGFSGKMKQEN